MFCSAVGPVYLIAVLVVLEAGVVVHETIQFLEALVLLLCLKNHIETPSCRSWNLIQAALVPAVAEVQPLTCCTDGSAPSLAGLGRSVCSVPLQSSPWTAPPPAG